MTQEERDLLFKDLCARLPYGVKCDINDNKPYTLSSISNDYDGTLIRFKEQKNGFNMEVYLSEVKPYLFPLSSMTEEQKQELKGLIMQNAFSNNTTFTQQDFFCKYHLDYRGLIQLGLAIDATNENIY
jgi:hypothetical protein